MDKNLIWMIIGFVGQGFFSARFILQWVMSEIKKQSIQDLKIKKYYYTIKTKLEFKKYSKNNNLIFENL